MTESVELKAYPREFAGKANRRLHAAGRLPGVVYGGGNEPISVALDRHDAELLLAREGVGSLIVKLGIEGRDPMDTVVKAVQSNPVKGFPQHVDFLAVNADTVVSTQVPIHFVGDAAGVKTGGVLMHTVQALHIQSLPGDLPEAIEIDVTALEVGDNLTVGEITLPSGVTVLDDADLVLCSVTAPSEAPTAEESAAAPEPEVIGAEE